MAEVTVEVVTDYGGFLSLEQEWSTLLRSSRCNSVFLTHEWLRCWWETYGAEDQLFVVCVRDGARLIGAAPLYLRKTRFRSLPVRSLSFMANSLAEQADIILAPPERPALLAMLNYLANQPGVWEMMDLRYLRGDSPFLGHLPKACGAASLLWTTRPTMEVPYIPVDTDWHQFLSRRSQGFRKQAKRRIRRIRLQGEASQLVRLRSPEEILKAFPAIVKVSAMSWKAQCGRGLSDQSRALAFFERISSVLGSRGWIDLWMLKLGSEPVAFEYHLNYEGVTSPIRADFNETFRDLSPGAHLEHLILQSLFDDSSCSVREYNSCADSYAYLRRWTDCARPHFRARVFRRSLYGRILHALGLLRRPRTAKREEDSTSVRPLRALPVWTQAAAHAIRG